MKWLILIALCLVATASAAPVFSVTRDNGTITALYVDGSPVTVHDFYLAGGTLEPMPNFALGRVTPLATPTPVVTIPPTPVPTVTTTRITHDLKYHYGNLTGSIQVTTSAEEYNRFVLAQDQLLPSTIYRPATMRLENVLTNDAYQDYLMQPFIDKIKAASPNKADQARIAISILNQNQYDYSRQNGSMMVEYPYQALHTGKTICYDQAIEGAYVLSRLGFNTSVISFSIPDKGISHAMIGVATNGPSYKGSGYAAIDRGFIPGDCGQAETAPIWSVVQVSPGNAIDLSQENTDAKRMHELTPTANSTKEQYAEWNELINKYNL